MSRSPAPARAALLLAALLAAQFAATAPVADSDADGQSRALSDGLLALRFQFGFRAAALADGAVPEGATRTAPPAIADHLALHHALLDVDGDGVTGPTTDGRLLLRWLFGFRGPALLQGAVSGTPERDAGQIENYLAWLASDPGSGCQPWSDPATWGGSVPQAGQAVTIPAGHCIQLDLDPPPLGGVTVLGTLAFAPADLELVADWILVDGGTLRIGSVEQPFVHRATLTLTGDDPGADVMGMGTRGLLVMDGTLALHGSPPAVPWTKLNEHAAAGSTELNLAEPVTWQPGDQVVIAPTDFYGIAATESHLLAAAGGTALTLATPLAAPRWGRLQYPDPTPGGLGLALAPSGHVPPAEPAPGVLDERAEVGNLTRNIVIQAPDDTAWQQAGFGAHVMIMGLGSHVVIDGVALRRAGQAGRTGRYPVHWHRLSYHAETGAELGDAAGHVVRNSTVSDSANRCIVLHATNGVQIMDNICHAIRGHALFLENAVERRNLLVGNLVLQVRNPEPAVRLQVHEGPAFQVGSSGLWLTNPDNRVIGNSVADAEGNGLWLSFPATALGQSQAVALQPRHMALGEYADNTAHSNNQAGMNIDWVPIDAAGNVAALQYQPTATGLPIVYGENPSLRTRFSRVTLYKNRFGLWNRITEPDYEEFVAADNAGKYFDGSGFDGLITRGLVVGTSLNDATTTADLDGTPFAAVSPVLTPVAFASYHSTYSMTYNTVINFPFIAGTVAGTFATNDYYLRPVDKGYLRTFGNTLIESHPGYRSSAPFPYFVFAGALLDAQGLWGPQGNWWVYDTPFLTHGAACSAASPVGEANGMSCAGSYYGVRDFVLDHGNDYFYPLMALAVERLDDDGQVVGTWHVDGVAPEVAGSLAFPNMRHFAMQRDGRYVLRFPDYGGPPGDVIVTVENMHTTDDGALLAVEYDGTRDAWVFTSTYPNTPLYSAPFPGSDDHYHLYEEVANLAALHTSEGGTYWQDHDADLVWVKLRGGLADFFVEDPREFSDETLYNPFYLRIHD